ncbi:hypothetical protein B0J17DRAFT_772855 [Rhizoctonia solani]|nr:hypothetical protein B0J17DRAFT_772855 [Rhizoctonia solani]
MSMRIGKRRPALLRRQSSVRISLGEFSDPEDEENEKAENGFIRDMPFSKNGADAEKFRAFQRCISLLDLKLQSFANAIRQLGSSVGLLNATAHIQDRLPRIFRLFQENASKLFDIGVVLHSSSTQANAPNRTRRSDSWHQTRRALKSSSLQSLNINSLPNQMEALATDLFVFIDRLNDVPEFVDEAVHTTHEPVIEAFKAFAGDLRYRADCLSDFGHQLNDVAITRHINELTEDLCSYADRARGALDGFIEVGVPAIRYSQERTATHLQNLSTVATFFSGVTATTIQVSFELHGDVLQDLLNALWIGSLAFSIASAINSQLAYHWREAVYRSPRCYVPWWVLIWIVYTPLFFLVISAIAFLIGLCVFTYSSAQSPAVTLVITAFTVFTSSALLCVGLWFALERWAYMRTQGRRWLLQILEDGIGEAWKPKSWTPNKALSFARGAYNLLGGIALKISTALLHPMPRFSSPRVNNTDDVGTKADEEAQYDETRSETTVMAREDLNMGGHTPNDLSRKRKPWTTGKDYDGRVRFPEHELTSLDVRATHRVIPKPQSNSTIPSPTGATASNSHTSQGEKRFAKQVKAVRAGLFQKYVAETRDFLVDSDVSKLCTLPATRLPSQHIGQVGHFQFSPDGQHLATCSWDRVTYVWKLEDGPSIELNVIGRLVHPGMPDVVDAGQLAWSPSGDQLLTKYRGSIALWNPLKNVYYQKHLVRRQHAHVQSVVWMPLSSGFLSVEWRVSRPDYHEEESTHHTIILQETVLVRFDTTGRQMEEHMHTMHWLQVWDLAVMPDEKRLVAVASLIQSPKKYRPINTSHQKRIIVYNLETKQIESQMPLMLDVRGVTLGKTGNISRALVSYENNAPQTWYIEQRNQKYQLKLIKTYYPKPPVEFAGNSCFGTLGKDSLVLAASRAGEVYIWDPPSGNLIHTHATSSNQELTGLAWNPKPTGNSLMFASAMRDGTIHIWNTAPELASNTSGSRFGEASNAKQSEAADSDSLIPQC